MNYRLVFSPMFNEDLKQLYSYISQELANPSAARNTLKAVKRSVLSLKAFPFSCPLCIEPLGERGYRKMPINNYIVIYSVDNASHTVNLLRCVYARSDYADQSHNTV